ncbi:MAG: hypothetical protein KDK99_03830 [Verrucomicrobiales bacterium]|nr:hypothetical protein [Verrucomicrobiales bacterium]
MTSFLNKSVIVAAACVALNAQAGTSSSKGTVQVMEIVEESAANSLGAELAAGYDSSFYFRGLNFSDNNVWTSLSASIPLTEALSLDAFGFYTNSTSNTFSRLDLGAALSFDAGPATLALAYNWYHYFDGVFGNGLGFDNAQELGVTAAVPLGMVNLGFAYFYDFQVEAHYLQAGVDTTIEVNDWLSIVPSAVIGYGIDGYYTFGTAGTAWNHVGLNLAFPIQLTKSATLTPYVAANFSLDGRDQLNADKNAIYGGVSLSVSF